MSFLGESRERELSTLGWSKERIYSSLSEEMVGIIETARQSGRNPADVFYELAKMRGYRPARTPTAKRLAPAQRAGKQVTLEQPVEMSSEEFEKYLERAGTSGSRLAGDAA